MPGPIGTADALYLPHLNQVWLDDPNEKVWRHSALPHELYHFFSSSTQPSMLLPLRDYLIGRLNADVFRCFEDIVEPLALIMVPTLSGEGLDPARLGSYPQKHVELVGCLLVLADHLARFVKPGVESAMVDAISAIGFVLLHVFSYRPGNGRHLINVLQKRKKWDEWSTRWDLFFQLHSHIRLEYEKSHQAQARYHLSPPVDVHRTAGEFLVFMSGALRAAQERPNLFVGAVPSLLAVLSMGTFLVLPVVSLSRRNDTVRGVIRVIHSTRRGESAVRGVIDTQTSVAESQRGRHSDCEAMSFFVGVIQELYAARVSRSTNRIGEICRGLLRLAPAHAVRITRSQTECPGCKAVFRDHTVAAAGHHIALMPEAQHGAFTAGVDRFEDWLRNRCVQEAFGAAHDHVKVRTVKRYSYL